METVLNAQVTGSDVYMLKRKLGMKYKRVQPGRIPEFHGKPNENVSEWLESVEIYTEITDGMKGNRIGVAMRGAVGPAQKFLYDIFSSVAKTEESPTEEGVWQLLKTQLLLLFGPGRKSVYEIHRSLTSLQQTTSVVKYARKFLDICSHFEDPNYMIDPCIINRFIMGLKPSLEPLVVNRVRYDSGDLLSTIFLAKDVEALVNARRK